MLHVILDWLTDPIAHRSQDRKFRLKLARERNDYRKRLRQAITCCRVSRVSLDCPTKAQPTLHHRDGKIAGKTPSPHPHPPSVLFPSLWCNSGVPSSGPIRVIYVIRGHNRLVPSSQFSGGPETAAEASSGDGRHYKETARIPCSRIYSRGWRDSRAPSTPGVRSA